MKAYVALLAALTLLSAAALFGTAASAQRGKNDNASQKGGSSSSSRRVFVGRGSDTSSGSRVTIKSDDPLNDYSAYRSGDRFYVVLPKSAAGAISKGSGKGYTDVQVQQRGDSVVVSYKVQPGAKPRVEQKFNRLDVVFDVKEGAQPAASGQDSSAAARQQPASENRNPNASAQQQQQQQQQAATQPKSSTTAETPNERRPAEVAPNTQQPGAPNTSSTAAQAGEAATQPANAQTQAVPSPAGEQTASTAPTAEPQVARNQPPAPIAPITNPNSSVAGAQAGSSFGTMLVNNWPIPLFVTLVLVGLGLVFFARRSTGHAPPEIEAAEVATTTATTKKKVEEPRAALLKEATPAADSIAAKSTPPVEAAPPVESKPLVEAALPVAVAPLVTAATVATGKKKKKKDRKAKTRGGRVEELSLAEAEKTAEPSVVELPVAEPSVIESSVAESSVTEPSFAEPSVAETPAEIVAAAPVEEAQAEVSAPSVEEAPAEVADASVEDTAVEELEMPTIEAAATEAVSFETPAAVEAAEAEAPREVSIEPAVVAVEPSAAKPSVESVVEPTAEPVNESVVESVVKPEAEPVVESVTVPVRSIAPADAPDAEAVQAQTRSLLEGESYDRSVIGSEDSMARQLIGAELLSALSGRNAERRERARAAFVEHGYFDEKARDVRDAAAPAERAAAARSLAIVGERAAAPHLISALEDDSMEVRRAAVEALGALREPTAIEPLEALLQRERIQRNRIPNRIIQHAVETCRLAAAEESLAAEAPAAVETPEAETVETEAVETGVVEAQLSEPEALTLTHEVAEAPHAVEDARVEDAAQVEAFAPRVEVEETAPQAEEVAPGAEDVARTEDVAPHEAAMATAAPVEEVLSLEGPTHADEVPTLEATAFELDLDSAEAETPFTESNAVEPFFYAPQVSESDVAEPRAEEELHAPSEVSGVESAVESEDKSLAPLVASGEREESANADEWFEFDMSDIRAPERAPEPERATAPTAESLFEFSSGETMRAESVAETEARTPAVESLPFETAAETPTIETSFETREAEALFESSAAETLFSEGRKVEEPTEVSAVEFERAGVSESSVEPSHATGAEAVTAPLPDIHEKGVMPFNERSTVPAVIQQRLTSRDASVRAAAITELSHVDSDEAFQQICSAFDDEAKEVRSAAARSLYELRADRAESFTRALREANPDRRRNVGSAISSSGLAGEAISQLTGESRDKTYEAFSLLFLMAKAGEVQPLVRAIEGHPNNEVRLAVVKLLALSGQKEILPAFRRLAVRGSLPTEVRSAVMEAIYQISSSQPTTV
ncbi:MAG: HEAT repeat domain-containing protein [Pyrinomonadaceae bacterium]